MTVRSKRVVVCLVGALVLLVAACGGGDGQPAPTVQVATLHILGGSAEVGSGASFSAAVDGQEVHEGDTVRTGADGRVAIEYFDGSITRLDHDTSFTIVTLEVLGDGGPTTIVGDQGSGATYNRVVELTDSASRFDVQTPTAIASVQGTVYAVIFNPDGSISFVVVDGTVIVTVGGESVEVPAGYMVTVGEDGTIGEVVPIPDELLAGEWIEYNQCVLDDEGECVVEAVFDHIEISPAVSTIAAGDAQAFTVEAFDQGGQSMGDVTADASVSGEACIAASCAPTEPGDYTITAEYMGSTAAATLTVEPGPVQAIEITPESASVEAGVPQAFAAEGFDAFGNPVGPVDASYSMLGGACADDECSSTDVGEYIVTGSYQGATDTASLAVTVGPLDHIIVSPSVAAIEAGGSQGYSARGYDEFGNPRGAVAATFSITNGSCASVNCGSTVAGAQTVTGVYAGRADTASLEVNPGPVDSIEISPQVASITAGESQAYAAEGFDQYGNSTGAVAAEYAIYPIEAFADSSGDPVATAAFGVIPWSCDGNECGSTNAGAYEVEGAFGEFFDSAMLQVTAGDPADVELWPISLSGDLGDCEMQTFTVYVVDTYGNVTDVETDIDFIDADGGAQVFFDPVSGTKTTASGWTSIDVYGSAVGTVQLRADADEFGLQSNVVAFDVYACLAFTGPVPGDSGGTLLFVLIGLLAVPGLRRLRWTAE